MGPFIFSINSGIPSALLLQDLGILGRISKNPAAAFPPFSQLRQQTENIPIGSISLFPAHNGAGRQERSRKGFSSAHGMTGCGSLPTANSFVPHSHSRRTKQFQQKFRKRLEPSNPVAVLFQPFLWFILMDKARRRCCWMRPSGFWGEFLLEKAGRSSRNLGKHLGSVWGVTSLTKNNPQIFPFQRVSYTGKEGKQAQPGARKDPSQKKTIQQEKAGLPCGWWEGEHCFLCLDVDLGRIPWK